MEKIGQELLNEIIQLVRAVRNDRRIKIFDCEMSKLTMAQNHTLQLLYDKEKATMTELSDYAKVKMPTMTDTVARLEKAGYAKRKHSDKDRRVVHCYLTESGKKLVTDYREMVVKHIEDFMGVLSNEERAMITGLLKKVKSLFATGN